MRFPLMKIIGAVMLMVSVGNTAFSQTSWEAYYPLRVGDVWEFLDFGTVPMTLTRKVLSDTVMPNGKRYAVIEEYYHDGPHPGRAGLLQYERIDSAGNVFAYLPITCEWPLVYRDTLRYKLNGNVGDTIKAVCRLPNTFWRIRQKDSTLFFDGQKEFSEFELVNDVVRGLKTIVQHFGLIYMATKEVRELSEGQ